MARPHPVFFDQMGTNSPLLFIDGGKRGVYNEKTTPWKERAVLKTLVLEKQGIKNNITAIKQRAGSAVVYAVLAGDARGAGTVELARLLRDEGISRFAVAELSEAQALRKAGLVEEEILMLRSTTDKEELGGLLDLNVVCTIASVEAGLALNAVAEARSTVAEALVQVDSGLGFGGFFAGDVDKILSAYRNLPNVAVSGIYTQIQARGLRRKEGMARLEAFFQLVKQLHAQQVETGLTHISGSYALLHWDLTGVDGVRVSSALLGRCRRGRGDGLLRVGYGEVPIQETHWLPKGYVLEGETAVSIKRPTRVAVLPVGYHNGFGVSPVRDAGLWASLRRWWRARNASVRIDGERARVLGRIGAMQTLVDITDLKCGPGDLAYFDIDPLYARGFTREYR